MNTVAEVVSGPEEGDNLDDGIARFLGVSDPEEGIKLADVSQKAANELQRYGDDLLQRLADKQITVPPPFQLRSLDGGNIGVVGDHPQRSQIESLLNADTYLLKWFKEIEVLHEILRRSEFELHGGEGQLTDQQFNLGLTSLGAIGFFTGD